MTGYWDDSEACDLAHVDAPDLLIALRKAEAERDGMLAMVAKVTAELEDYQNDSDVGDAADYLLTILTATPAQSLAAHDAEVAATALEEAARRVIAASEDLRDSSTCRSIAHSLRLHAAEYRKTETEGGQNND